MNEMCRKKKKAALKVLPETAEVIRNYRWPGNVRELQNAIERMIILNENGSIGIDDLPEHIRSSRFVAGTQPGHPGAFQGALPIPMEWTDAGIDLNGVLEELERSLILQALKQSGGVKNKAASLLGLNRTTLTEKIKKKGLATAAIMT